MFAWRCLALKDLVLFRLDKGGRLYDMNEPWIQSYWQSVASYCDKQQTKDALFLLLDLVGISMPPHLWCGGVICWIDQWVWGYSIRMTFLWMIYLMTVMLIDEFLIIDRGLSGLLSMQTLTVMWSTCTQHNDDDDDHFIYLFIWPWQIGTSYLD